MAPSAAQALEGFIVSGSKTAVIVGGTNGIGAATARRLAQHGCDRIIIFGRSEKKGNDMLERLKKLSLQPETFVGQFVSGDLTSNKGIQAATDALESALGATKVDILVMTQGGTPRGFIEENEDGNDKPFTSQVLSRFVILYRLVTHSFLAPDAVVVVVANTGQDLPDLKIEDLSLKERVGKKSKVGLFLQQSARDSVVLDSFVEEFHGRYPEYHFYHIYPGLVKSENFHVGVHDFPFPLNWIGSLLAALFATTPDYFAQYPAYVALNRKGQIDIGDNRYFGHKLQPRKNGTWAQNEENRKQLWTKLVQMTGQS